MPARKRHPLPVGLDRRAFLHLAGVGGGLAAVAALPGCSAAAPEGAGGGAASAGRVPSAEEPPVSPESARVLLAYFSRPGENYFYGDRIDLAVGNTQVVADMIAELVPVDVYRIEAADPYPDSYDATVARNRREQQEDARPGIADPLPDVSGYDTVILGSPIWNVRPPMIMRTFLDQVDLAGTTVHPLVTYAISGMGSAVEDYTAACPDSTIGEPLAVRGEEAADAREDVTAWLNRIGLAR